MKTDTVVLQGYATKHKKALRQIAERTFEDLPHLRAICAQVERGQTQLYDDKRCSMAQRNGDAEKCFRYSVGDAVNLLQGDYRTPKMKASPPTPVEPWVWLSEEEALKARGDLFLDGCPGTGKSTFARTLVERLRAEGLRVDVVAKTHAATKSIGCGAVTLDHYVLRHVRAGALNVDILLVDEVTQVNSALWCDLVLCHQYGVKLILVGDLSQFSACCDSWFDQSLGEDALGRSDMLRTLVASRRFRLTENRRSDPQIFDYVTGLSVGEPDARSLEEALEDAKKRFPVRADRAPDWTIVLSHARRHQVN